MVKTKNKTCKASNTPVPILENEGCYDTWKGDIQRWEHVTNVIPSKRAMCIYFTLTGRARAAAYQVSIPNLMKADGVKTLLQKLDSIFLPDKDRRQYNAYHNMHKMMRESGASVHEFICEYEFAYFRFQQEDMTWPDSVAALNLMSACRLSEDDLKIVLSAPKEMTYDNMKATLLRIFSNDKNKDSTGKKDSSDISVETVPYGNDKTGDAVFYSTGRRDSRGWESSSNRNAYKNRNNGKMRSSWNKSNRGNYGRNSDASNSWDTSGSRKLNPMRSGKVSTCAICNSIYHWAKDCQHSKETNRNREGKQGVNKPSGTSDVHFTMFVGCTSSLESNHLNDLVNESNGYAILDSGCSTTVCGENWLRNFMEALSTEHRSLVKVEKSNQTFTFGDGKTVVSSRKMTLPCWMGGMKGEMCTDVVDCNIPLLLSRKSMKATGMILNFKKDEVSVGGRAIKLKITKSGHLALPISL